MAISITAKAAARYAPRWSSIWNVVELLILPSVRYGVSEDWIWIGTVDDCTLLFIQHFQNFLRVSPFNVMILRKVSELHLRYAAGKP